MRRQPALAVAQELFDLILTDPIVLLRVKYGNKNVKVGEQVLQPNGAPQTNGVVGALSPFRKLFIKRVMRRDDVVAQRFEQAPEKCLAPAAGEHRDLYLQRQDLFGKLRPFFTGSGQGAAKYPGDGYAQERRCDVGTVVDVLVQRARLVPRSPTVSHQAHGVDVQQQSCSTAIRRHLRVKNVSLAKRQFEGLASRRVLVKQIPEITCWRFCIC